MRSPAPTASPASRSTSPPTSTTSARTRPTTAWCAKKQHCAAALLLSFKLLDSFKKIDAVCAAYFACRKAVLGRDPLELLDKEELGRIRERVVAAESNLLKAIGYDFNLVTPNRLLVELRFAYAAEDANLLNVAKVMLLDLHRAGCCLFYKPVYLATASYLLAHLAVKGRLYPAAAPPAGERGGQAPGEVHVEGLPPAYFFRLRDFSLEEIKRKLGAGEAREGGERSAEEGRFRAWLEDIEPGMSLSRLWEVLDLFEQAVSRFI